MQQLSGLDASFLYFETPNAPMHVGGILVYDQSTAAGGRVTSGRRVGRIPRQEPGP
jgi:diacylglycerol O-acyltransferase / wax synthase